MLLSFSLKKMVTPAFHRRRGPIPGAEAGAFRFLNPFPRLAFFSFWLVLLLCLETQALQIPVDTTGLGYTNFRVSDIPWSIHVVRVTRSNSLYEVHSLHAGKKAIGLDTLSEQLGLLDPALGSPVAAVNGDFYQRDRTYAGSARGLQVVDGELISGPGRKYSFWIDAADEAHLTNVTALFEVTWPDGTKSPFRLNGERSPNGIELYTPAIGRSTRTFGGRELVLERAEGSGWLPLRLGKTYSAAVREVRDKGDTPVAPDKLVLSLGPGPMRRMPELKPGAILQISTATAPALHGVKTAISGGPILVRNGRRQKTDENGPETYEMSSMFERHPRAAIGWNQNSIFLVEVDGRQHGLSVGMTLDELANFMVALGCQDAMNFDGGGSATLWYDGEVRNSPCDRAERDIANCLVIVKKKLPGGTSSASNHP
jgi:hypothetical protein